MRFFAAASLLTCLCVYPGCNGPGASRGTPMITEVQRESWQSPYATGQALTSEHYRIFSTARSYAVRTYLPGFMEAAYANYSALTGLADLPAREPMPIYMLSSRREWAALTRTVLGESSEALNVEAGGYCHNGICVFWEIGGTGTFSVASHEGMHQFLYHRLKDRLPKWLEEGLATQAEGHRIQADSVLFTPADNPSRFSSLRSAIVNDRWVPLEDLLAMEPVEAMRGGTERAVGYYGQLWALVQFIRSDAGYRAGMQRLLGDARDGQLHVAMNVPASALVQLKAAPQAYNRAVSVPLFKHYVSSDLAGFENRYADFAKKLARLQ